MERCPKERIENLGSGIRIVTAPGRSFGLDAIVLSGFSRPRRGARICDFGTGCGIIPLLWFRASSGFTVDAVEIEPETAKAAGDSVALNHLETSIRVICGDYLTCPLLPDASYDLIVCNPPYFRAGAGKSSPSELRNTARRESARTGIPDIVAKASRLLKTGGRFCVSLRPERLPEYFSLMTSCRLEPKRFRAVQHDTAARPSVFLCEGVKNALPGLAAEPVLLENSSEMAEIFGNYKD